MQQEKRLKQDKEVEDEMAAFMNGDDSDLLPLLNPAPLPPGDDSDLLPLFNQGPLPTWEDSDLLPLLNQAPL